MIFIRTGFRSIKTVAIDRRSGDVCMEVGKKAIKPLRVAESCEKETREHRA